MFTPGSPARHGRYTACAHSGRVRQPLIAALLVVSTVVAGVVATPDAATAASPALPAGDILLNEVANGAPGSDSDTFFELRNWGRTAVDLSGWNVYRCSVQGLRSNVGRPEADLHGVVLEPGEIFTVSKVGMVGDAHSTQPLSTQGVGLYLETPGGVLVDAVGVYPNEPWPTESECTVGANLPNVLDYAAGESWQRVAATGDTDRDFIVAPSTLGEANATREAPRARTGVVIAELAPSGPAGVDDEFVELLNTSDHAVDIGGWSVYRCTATGRLRPDTLELRVEDGTTIDAGDRWVLGGPGFTGTADATYPRHLADVASGVLVRDAQGLLVDREAISSYGDSACQDEKLPATLDYVAAESYQLTDEGFIVAGRTPGRRNATTPSSVAAEEFSYPTVPGVAISEWATDPAREAMPVGLEPQNYVELGNYGDEPAEIGGFTIRRCESSGIRSREVQATVPAGTTLAPGATFLAAHTGTPAAVGAHATFATAFDFLGSGVWLADAEGRRVDSVGAFAMNEMDQSLVTPSPCTKGVGMAAFAPDRMLGETFQRTRFTGGDDDDFVTAPATPGVLDAHEWSDPTLRVPTGATGVPAAKAVSASTGPEGRPVTVVAAFAGVSDGPLVEREGRGETAVDPAAPGAAVDAAWGHPYQRFVLDAAALEPGSTVTWSGEAAGRGEVQLSVWDAAASAWRLLDAGAHSLSGTLAAADIADGVVVLLAQSGPRTRSTLAAGPDGTLERPVDYDVAISHITDTQYLSESYPGVYAELVSWIADNARDRKIAFATHTGDLVQNWVDPNQDDVRARREFERASAAQGILDDAGIANSVLPGNHDNKRGVGNELFNEYFPPSRYAGSEAYAGSIAPGDNSANYSTFEREGARFLMLSLPYAYGEREIAWAEEIVTTHPGHNVVVSTHEHVTPESGLEDAHRSANSRWVSRGQELWDRVIAPNRNVVVVLSGHFHGIGRIVTEDAGGIEGHDVVELLADYQEFRTHTGERATGFQRLLQIDLASSTIAVDTLSVRLGATASFEYDYQQFVPDSGTPDSRSNSRPWRVVEAGVQHRYTVEDDEFAAPATFQYEKSVTTTGLGMLPPAPDAPAFHSSVRLDRVRDAAPGA
jgi:hypothetical protein